MGGRGGAGKRALANAMSDSKQLKSLNQRIGRLESNLNIVNGGIPAIMATESGRKRYQSAKRTENADRQKLEELREERDRLNKRIGNRMSRAMRSFDEDIPF